jgi:hypothetical protein
MKRRRLMSKVFNRVGVPKVGRSLFNLTHSKTLSGQMGYLYPSMYEDCIPGDVFSIGKRIKCRFIIPPLSPLMHEVNLYEHTFFVPYRLLMNEDELGDSGDFEDMIIGGSDGDTAITIPTVDVGGHSIGNLKDYMGYPPIGGSATGAFPVAFQFRAYNLIFNEYYRDIDLDTELDITSNTTSIWERRWQKDYFTSARPYQQRGTPPALPLTGTIDIDGKNGNVTVKNENDSTTRNMMVQITSGDIITQTAPSATGGLRWVNPQLEVDLSSGAITADVADLRLIFQTQRWMERNMRAGTRYKEVIKAHFNEDVGDSRLDRPEYIGGIKVPIVISEVIGTNQDDTVEDPGSLAGHAIGIGQKFIGKYRVKEFGIMMSILSVMPVTMYSQGIDRQWRKDTLYDFYWPEFANLSEQAVLTSEIWATTVEATNDTVFGYQGRYNEYRVRHNTVHGQLRYGGNLTYWTLAREFASQPSLTANFVRSRYSAGFEGGIRSDIFPVTTGDNLVIQVGNVLKASRPLPLMSNPGLVDHG